MTQPLQCHGIARGSETASFQSKTARFPQKIPGPAFAGAACVTFNDITSGIIGAGMRVHAQYGPGLLESVYTTCLAHELVAAGHIVEVEKPINLQHDGLTIHRAYVLDLLVEGKVIVEVKCITALAPIHTAQLLTYLRLMKLQVGLILNFKVTHFAQGIKRVVNEYVDEFGNRL